MLKAHISIRLCKNDKYHYRGDFIMSQCIICQHNLSGRQTKFCSAKCKNKDTNNKHQNYQAQQARGRDRRKELIMESGGECSMCGYNRNLAALCFHHVDENTKAFQITIRECSNNKIEVLKKEVNKCIVLCHNCHMEHHYPSSALPLSYRH